MSSALAFAFGWTPCIGPVLGAILAVAAGEDSVSQGVSLLFVYSLGLGIPFVLAAVAIRPFMSAMQRFRGHLAMMEKVLGGFLVLTGILFLTNSMTLIAGWILQTFPALATHRLTTRGLLSAASWRIVAPAHEPLSL